MRVGKYLVYNTGEDPIFIKKGEILGYCSLIYQDSMEPQNTVPKEGLVQLN